MAKTRQYNWGKPRILHPKCVECGEKMSAVHTYARERGPGKYARFENYLGCLPCDRIVRLN